MSIKNEKKINPPTSERNEKLKMYDKIASLND